MIWHAEDLPQLWLKRYGNIINHFSVRAATSENSLYHCLPHLVLFSFHLYHPQRMVIRAGMRGERRKKTMLSF